MDECEVDGDYPDEIGPCGEKALCFNTVGSFFCQCADGFRSTTRAVNFSAGTSATCVGKLHWNQCRGHTDFNFLHILVASPEYKSLFVCYLLPKDINECLETEGLCGPNATCYNTAPFYSCICNAGFISPGVERFRHGENVTCRGKMQENVLIECASIYVTWRNVSPLHCAVTSRHFFVPISKCLLLFHYQILMSVKRKKFVVRTQHASTHKAVTSVTVTLALYWTRKVTGNVKVCCLLFCFCKKSSLGVCSTQHHHTIYGWIRMG